MAPLPRWWMWRPEADLDAIRRAAKRKRFWARVVEWDVVLAAEARDVVHCDQFTDPAQRRRAGRLCAHFDAMRDLDARRVAQVEHLLWRALVALRDSLPMRAALHRETNRPGLAAAIAEPTRELAELDRRLDQFESALRIVVEESDPELTHSALRRVAALDPLHWSPRAPGRPHAEHDRADDDDGADQLQARRVVGSPGHEGGEAEGEDQHGEHVLHETS
ncbi:hypothetical protein [Saccharothrix texasensis]|uniref:hypothetical protein n=1 Tax=Saccharothrix texasensis TaxID=103734 RepID=UPI001476F615|nr:hypothetical protein [Saccharothrix texasensis]